MKKPIDKHCETCSVWKDCEGDRRLDCGAPPVDYVEIIDQKDKEISRLNARIRELEKYMPAERARV